MTGHDERWVELLQPLDPANQAAEPRRGSIRYESILEAAMLTTDHHISEPTFRARRRRPRFAHLGAAGAAAAIVVIGLVIVRPAGEVAPAAAITTAADALGDVDSFRSTFVSAAPDGTIEEASAEFDGGRVRIVSHDDDEELITTVIGSRLWETTPEGTTMVSSEQDDRPAPFPASCEAVLNAALDGAAVQELGTEQIDGADARHLRLELSDESRAALFALPPSELAWFDLEGPGSVEVIDVWVAEGLIRRLRIEHAVQDDGSTYGGETETIDFFDFGADITIEPPT
jgi:outer membrane lipoprotein-sorting protein